MCSQMFTVVLPDEDLECFSAQLIITQLAVYSVYFNEPIFFLTRTKILTILKNHSSSLFSEDYTLVS